MNPPDLSSRGIRAGDAKKWDIYLNDHLFLREKEENWPVFQADPTPKDQIAYVNATRVLSRTYDEELSLWWYDKISRVLGWLKKINMMAAVLKVTTKWRAKVVISRKNRNKEEDKDETKRKTKKDFNRRQEKDWKEVSSGIESQRSELRAESERMMIKAIQVKCLQSERQDLRLKGVNLPNRRNDMKTDGETKISLMAEHNPFIHTDGLIRVGS